MNYTTIMRDSASYINHHTEEPLDGEYMGQIYSYTEHYYNYLFSSYYIIPLNDYINQVRQKKETEQQMDENAWVREMPGEEEIDYSLMDLDDFYLSGTRVDKSGENVYDPMKVVSREYETARKEGNLGAAEEFFSLWWHDETYTMEYVEGRVCHEMTQVPEGQIPVRIGKSKYAVFSLKEGRKYDLESAMKMLVHYVYGIWIPKHEVQTNRLGATFHCVKNQTAYFCVPLLEKEKQEPIDKIYSIGVWTKYIDDHITMNLTTTALAEQFLYSETHFKRIFRYYYKMSVSDYIRKRKLQAAAEEIRDRKSVV